jgi:hypothetical protein
MDVLEPVTRVALSQSFTRKSTRYALWATFVDAAPIATAESRLRSWMAQKTLTGEDRAEYAGYATAA